MNVIKYLNQSRKLEQRIEINKLEINKLEINDLRELSTSVKAIRYDKDRIQISLKTQAPFIKYLVKIEKLEEKIRNEMDMLIALRIQTRETINTLTKEDERLVLIYRYCNSMTWQEIAYKTFSSRTSVIRCHNSAIRQLKLPDDYIDLSKL